MLPGSPVVMFVRDFRLAGEESIGIVHITEPSTLFCSGGDFTHFKYLFQELRNF